MTETIHIGKRIRLFREHKGLTQKQLGDAAGIIEATIRKYEIGQRNPKPEQIKLIADALEITSGALTGYDIRSDADVLAMILALDELGLIEYVGKSDKVGGIAKDTLAIRIKNNSINTRLSAWTAIKENLEEKKKDKSDAGKKEYADRLIVADEAKVALMNCKISL